MATIEFLFSIICGTSVPNNELFRKFPFLMSFKTESSRNSWDIKQNSPI